MAWDGPWWSASRNQGRRRTKLEETAWAAVTSWVWATWPTAWPTAKPGSLEPWLPRVLRYCVESGGPNIHCWIMIIIIQLYPINSHIISYCPILSYDLIWSTSRFLFYRSPVYTHHAMIHPWSAWRRRGGDFDVPKMDLPKPGESLFGKPSKNKRLGTTEGRGSGRSLTGWHRLDIDLTTWLCMTFFRGHIYEIFERWVEHGRRMSNILDKTRGFKRLKLKGTGPQDRLAFFVSWPWSQEPIAKPQRWCN